jgi:phospholipid/cholesterol/gamma-HCH transport system ATP-binding protein
MVEVRGLRQRYDERWVLDGIDLEVRPGEILVVMGGSGGGKTTLLKCVGGLLPITEGDVLVDGVSVKREPEAAHRRLGLVFQYAALFDFLNVEDNVLFGVRRRRRLKAGEGRELVRRLLAEVGLDGIETLYPGELSGGMRKRVGLARALATGPRLLLYDEPTSGLDPVTAYSIDQLIVQTRDRTGATSLVVSHDLTSVVRVADRIAFLDAGRIVFLGQPHEFLNSSEAPVRDLVDRATTTRIRGAVGTPFEH